jgi:hypothetical protein
MTLESITLSETPAQPHRRAAVVQDVDRPGPRPVHNSPERSAEPGPEDSAAPFQAIFHPVLAVAENAVPQAAELLLELGHARNRLRSAHGGKTAVWFQSC